MSVEVQAGEGQMLPNDDVAQQQMCSQLWGSSLMLHLLWVVEVEEERVPDMADLDQVLPVLLVSMVKIVLWWEQMLVLHLQMFVAILEVILIHLVAVDCLSDRLACDCTAREAEEALEREMKG
jgi:hypothetical protein